MTITTPAPPPETLTEADLAAFARLGIPQKLLAEAHICRVTDAEARAEYGIRFGAAADLSGVLFRYYSPVTGQRTTARVRRDHPEIDADGKAQNKYILAYGDGRHLYFPPGAAALLEQSDMPIVLVEAEKSTLALTAWATRTGTRLLPIGMGGCWSWRGVIGKQEAPNGEREDVKGPLPDLSYCDGRKVFVLLDANAETNDKVAAARSALCIDLRKRKCEVLIADLTLVDGVNGPDDYIGVCGDAAMAKVFAAAHPPQKEIATPVLSPFTAEEAAASTSGLLDTLIQWILTYVVVKIEQAEIMAAWIMHSYVFELFEVTPYLFVSSPEKESGKSTLVRILRAVACRGMLSTGISAAALARRVEKDKPSLFLDELDATFKGDKEKAEAIRGILDSGFEPDGAYTRCVGKNFEVKDFPTFCPKVLAGIGELWNTVVSRSIPIAMRRKLPTETIKPDRQREIKTAANAIKVRLDEWATRVSGLLEPIRPQEIEGFSPRQNDNSEPLLAIAMLAGEQWRERLTTALVSVYKGTGSGDASTGVMLLTDIRDIFAKHDAAYIPSKDIAAALCKIEGHPWAEWSHGRELSANRLARLVRPYHIYPQTVRLGGETPKGYRKTDFADAWGRYCPSCAVSAATAPHPASLLAKTALSNRNASFAVAVEKSASEPHKQRAVACVADRKLDTRQLSLFDVPNGHTEGTEDNFIEAEFENGSHIDEERL